MFLKFSTGPRFVGKVEFNDAFARSTSYGHDGEGVSITVFFFYEAVKQKIVGE